MSVKFLMGTFWMLYDANNIYTGNSLWRTAKQAKDELKFKSNRNLLPSDGKWKIQKVHVESFNFYSSRKKDLG